MRPSFWEVWTLTLNLPYFPWNNETKQYFITLRWVYRIQYKKRKQKMMTRDEARNIAMVEASVSIYREWLWALKEWKILLALLLNCATFKDKFWGSVLCRCVICSILIWHFCMKGWSVFVYEFSTQKGLPLLMLNCLLSTSVMYGHSKQVVIKGFKKSFRASFYKDNWKLVLIKVHCSPQKSWIISIVCCENSS